MAYIYTAKFCICKTGEIITRSIKLSNYSRGKHFIILKIRTLESSCCHF